MQYLQGSIEAAAERNHCTIVQFNSPQSSTGYANHYGAGAAGFKAYHIRLSLTGSLASVLTMLRTLSDDKVPFEFTTIGFSPTGGSANFGTTNVLAQVELDALSQTEAS